MKLSLILKNRRLCLLSFLAFAPVFREIVLQRRRDPSAFATVDATNLIQVCLVFVAGIIILIDTGHKNKLFLKSSLGSFIVYWLFCALSAAWSTQPLLSLYRSFELIIFMLLMAHIIYSLSDGLSALKYLFWFAGLTVLLALIKSYINYGFYFSGYHTNSYSVPAAMGFVGLFAACRTGLFSFRQLWIYFLFGCYAAGLLLGSSAGSLVSAFLGLIAVSFFRKKGKMSPLQSLCVLFLLFGLFHLYLPELRNFLFPGKSDQAIYTLTGRTGVWEYYIAGFQEKPILGWGFPSGELEPMRFGFGGFTGSAHNGYMSIAINTGMIGIILFAFALVRIVRQIFNKIGRDAGQSVVLFSVLITVASNNMTYTVFGSDFSFPVMTVLGFIAYAALYLPREAIERRNRRVFFNTKPSHPIQRKAYYRPTLK